MGHVTVRGIKLAYTDVGQGPAVILLHGYPFNRTMWRDQADELREHYRFVIPDLRGHGKSSVAPGPATMEEMARDVAALLETLGITLASVGGLSMGGYVALAFYRLFPERVQSFMLADARAQADTEEIKRNRAIQWDQALKEGMAGIADSLVPKLLTSETLSSRPSVVERVRKMMVQTKPEGAAAALQGMAQRQDQTSFLPAITAPTLIIVGSEDKITPVAEAELMHRAIAGSRLEIIEGAGHVSNIEQPEKFNRALASFLRDVETA